VCVLVANGEPCLGPVTRTGCGALCPGLDRGCYGCFGPAQAPGNTDALGRRFIELGLSKEDAAARFRFITGWAPPFREAADELERGEVAAR
jgi:coenzyme F420-reducing hydrogenase gamma subunit